MSSSRVYRKATPTETEKIVRFQIEMARETEQIELDSDVLFQGVRAVFEDRSRGCYYVAEQMGGIVGCTLITYEWSDWRDGVVWWIQSVYVEPAFRKQGVYKGFYTYLKEMAQKDAQVRGIRLYVDRRNTAAQSVYEHVGMNG